MTHLRIEQSTGAIEEVSMSIISKLYELAYAGLDASSNLQGRLHSTAAYEYQIDYLTQNYPNLFITTDKSYLYFQDPEVTRVLATKFGDGTGVTSLNMASVTALRDQVFTGNTTVQTFDELVNFPNITSFTTCGGFARCTNLRSVDLSNIQHIGGETLQGCSSLAGVLNLPAIVSLGDSDRGSALRGCSSLTEIHFGPNFTTITGWYNMDGCTSLTTVTGLENFVNIPPYTFHSDAALQTVDISSAKIIQQYAFNNCGNLTDIGELSGTVQIGRDAFTGDTNLQQSCIDNVEVMLVNDSNGSVGGQFGRCHGLTEITLSPSCTQIGSWTFFDCQNLEKINNTSQITRIGTAAFNKCKKLQSLDLSGLDMTDTYTIAAFATDSPFNWDNGLFNDCLVLTTLGRTIFPNITHLGMRSFVSCGIGGSLNFPDLTDEASAMFQNCVNLEYLYLGHLPTLNESNPYNQEGQFLNCSSLKTVYLGDSISSFLPYHFKGCDDLRAIILNNSTVPTCYGDTTNQTPYDDNRVTQNTMFGNDLCFLYVPDSAVNTYKTTWPYSKFPNAIKSFKDYSDHFEFYNETFTNGKYQGYKFGSLNILDSSGSGSLPKNAFNSCVNLTNVTLEGISSIGVNAFGSCTSLESINLDGVTIDGDGAFIECTSLTTIGNNSMLSLFPNGKVRTWSFGKCSSLQGPFDFTGITEIGGSSFEKSGLSGILNLPDVVTIGSSNAFGNTNITKAIIGDSITSIGGSCFNGCTSLTEVDIDFSNIPVANQENMTSFVQGCTSLQTFDCTGLEKLAYSFFKDCTGLTSVIGLNSITTIGSNVFRGCNHLQSVDIDWTKITWIGGESFKNCELLPIASLNCTSLQTLDTPDAFRNCKLLQSITSLGTITTIPQASFNGCTGLTSVTLPSTLTTLGHEAFYGCTSLPSITLPSSCTSIGINTFYGCSSLASINLNNITTIQTRAFSGCTNLSNLGGTTFTGVTELGSQCFRSCTSLTGELNFPDVVTFPQVEGNIRGEQFMNCTGITKVSLGSITSLSGGLQTGHTSSFYGCASLVTVDIGSSLTRITTFCFNGCSALRNLIIRATTPPKLVFTGSNHSINYVCGNSNAKIYVPDASVNNYKTAAGWSEIASYIYPLSDYQA